MQACLELQKMTTTTKPMNRTTAAQNAQLFAELNGWHPELIKAEVRMRGTNLTKLAIENGMHRTALTKAIYEPLTKGEKIIAEFLGVSLHELWPDRWTVNGQRIRPRYAHKYITQAA